MKGTIKKQDVQNLLKSFDEKTKVFVPVEGASGAEFVEYAPGTEPLYNFSNTRLSVKGIFFPRSEVLCTFENESLTEVPLPGERYVVFGCRPCDAQSLVYMDKIFYTGQSRFKDPYYSSRRENSLIVSLACKDPCDTCFCTSVGTGPAGKNGSDLLMHDLGDSLLFESVSDEGEAFLSENKSMFADADEAAAAKADTQVKAAEEKITVIGLDGIKEKLDDMFDEKDWDELTRRCLGCGVCTFLCPTCHCFDITDEDHLPGEGRRIRSWDSCQYPLFTKHASGHNPRVNKKQRMRQRVMHKFSYTVEHSGDTYCVGCGRCVQYCPVNLDIRDILRNFAAKDVRSTA